MSLPRVSVVVTNHNYGRFLAECLRSAREQSAPPAEVIVVDDGSTDDSRTVLGAWPEVHCLLKDGGGQTSAMNAGFARSTGDVVVFLDADDVLEPDLLQRVAEHFQEPDTAVVHWRLHEVNAAGEPLARLRPYGTMPTGDLRARLSERGPATYEPPPTSGNAWSRRLLEAVLPLPEVERDLGVGSAHADVFLTDLAPFFGQVRVLARPGGRYRIHGSNDFAAHSELHRFERDRWLFAERCRRLSAFLNAAGTPHDVDAWERGSWVHLVQSVYSDIDGAIGDATFVLIDEQQLPVLIDPRRVLPFTSVGGVYQGPPSDDESAVRELEQRRGEGARAVVIASAAFWWLEHYQGMAAHLERDWTRVLRNDRVVVYSAV